MFTVIEGTNPKITNKGKEGRVVKYTVTDGEHVLTPEPTEFQVDDTCNCGCDCDCDDECSVETTGVDDAIKANLFQAMKPINADQLAHLRVNFELAKKGANSVSEIVGGIYALTAAGIAPEKAFEYLTSREMTFATMEHEINVCNINKEIAKETAKYGCLNSQKEQM